MMVFMKIFEETMVRKAPTRFRGITSCEEMNRRNLGKKKVCADISFRNDGNYFPPRYPQFRIGGKSRKEVGEKRIFDG